MSNKRPNWGWNMSETGQGEWSHPDRIESLSPLCLRFELNWRDQQRRDEGIECTDFGEISIKISYSFANDDVPNRWSDVNQFNAPRITHTLHAEENKISFSSSTFVRSWWWQTHTSSLSIRNSSQQRSVDSFFSFQIVFGKRKKLNTFTFHPVARFIFVIVCGNNVHIGRFFREKMKNILRCESTTQLRIFQIFSLQIGTTLALMMIPIAMLTILTTVTS